MSIDVQYFSTGPGVLGLAYGVSVIASLVGLTCVRLVATASGPAVRRGLTLCATASIGGVAVWLVHFLSLTGFDVPGSPVHYDVGLTAASMLLAVGSTGLALMLVGHEATWAAPVVRLVVGGVVMGLSVTAMHYTGMRAIGIHGSIELDPAAVATSVVIGVVLATAALWFTRVAASWGFRVVAALLMGAGVIALHHAGMAGMTVHVDPAVALPDGVPVMRLLFPAFAIGIVVLASAVAMTLLAPSRAEADVEDQIAHWLASDESDAGGPVCGECESEIGLVGSGARPGRLFRNAGF